MKEQDRKFDLPFLLFTKLPCKPCASMVTNFSARIAQPCVSSKKLQSSYRGRINFNLICLPMSYYHSNSTPAAAAAARGRRRFLLQFHDNFFPSFAFGPFQKPRSDLMPFSLMLLFLISMNQSTTTRMAVFLASNVFSLLLLLLLCYFFCRFYVRCVSCLRTVFVCFKLVLLAAT